MRLIYKNDLFSFTDSNKRVAYCDLLIFQDSMGFYKVIFKELYSNPGGSITNNISILSTLVYNEFLSGIPIEDIYFIENYHWPKEDETFDIVELEFNGYCFHNPNWRRVTKDIISNI